MSKRSTESEGMENTTHMFHWSKCGPEHNTWTVAGRQTDRREVLGARGSGAARNGMTVGVVQRRLLSVRFEEQPGLSLEFSGAGGDGWVPLLSG